MIKAVDRKIWLAIRKKCRTDESMYRHGPPQFAQHRVPMEQEILFAPQTCGCQDRRVQTSSRPRHETSARSTRNGAFGCCDLRDSEHGGHDPRKRSVSARLRTQKSDSGKLTSTASYSVGGSSHRQGIRGLPRRGISSLARV